MCLIHLNDLAEISGLFLRLLTILEENDHTMDSLQKKLFWEIF